MGFIESIKEPHAPEISIFVPFTRLWIVDEFLQKLSELELPREKCELVFFNDTNNRALQDTLRYYLEQVKDQYNGCTVFCSQSEAPTETDAMVRRERILQMKRKSVDLIADSKFVFCLEDDTLPVNNNVFTDLYETAQKSSTGFVSAVERGRWGFGIIGGWRMDDVHEPTMVNTIPFRESGIEEIDGGGWYCYITPTHLYKSIKYRFGAECFGPDVCYVQDVRRAGYKAYINWNHPCEHHIQNSKLLPSRGCMVVYWKRVRDEWMIVDQQ